MGKRLFSSDIEANGLADADKVWCASFQEHDTKMEPKGKPFTLTSYEHIREMFGNPDNILVMHNGIDYDGPTVTRILGVEIEAEIIDTLYLSWYLYPRNTKHGLGWWGEELGIAKPEVDDWTDQPIEVYVHRCEEDVKIQAALWVQMWKHLMLLYGNWTGCWHVVRHLNFKARCAALQKKSRWKLDLDSVQEQAIEYASAYEEAVTALQARMPDVPKYVKKKRPKKCFLANGDLSALGKKWADLVEENVSIDDMFDQFGEELTHPVHYEGVISIVSKYEPPNAGSTIQLKNWLYSLDWNPESFDHKRDKETNKVRKIPQIKNQQTEELCDSVKRLIDKEPALAYLETMTIIKHRLVIVNMFMRHVDYEGYVYAGVQGLTNTLRMKHAVCLNLPSKRKLYGERIRGSLTARSPLTELGGFDLDSLEDRTKQHFMYQYDPEYVLEMQKPDFDPHLDMCVTAKMLTHETIAWYKLAKPLIESGNYAPEEAAKFSKIDKIRHKGKGTNYSATYGAKGPTIARAAGVSDEEGGVLYDAYWLRNWSITAIADNCVVKTSRGMKWLWNPVAKIWYFLKADKDKFSTLNQSTATYAFDRWVYYVLERREQLTGQFHDEIIVEIKTGKREEMLRIVNEAMDDVNKELKLHRDLGCSGGFGRNYSEIH